MAEEKGAGAFAIKDAIVVVPILGSLLAICWEEGSFLPIGTSAFSYFSFSEHVNFAISALPVALMVAISMYIAAVASGPMGKHFIFEGDRIERKRVLRIERAALPVALAMVLMCLAAAYLYKSASFVALAISAVLWGLVRFAHGPRMPPRGYGDIAFGACFGGRRRRDEGKTE